MRNVTTFCQMPVEDVNQELIYARFPLLGIASWSDPRLVVLDHVVIERERRSRDSRRVCLPFHDTIEADDVESQNVQVLQF